MTLNSQNEWVGGFERGVRKGLNPTLKDPTSLKAFISFCSYYISDKTFCIHVEAATVFLTDYYILLKEAPVMQTLLC